MRKAAALGAAAVFMIVAALVSALVGAADLNPLTTVAALLDKIPLVHLPTSLSAVDQAVLFQIRLPRIVLGALVGGLLAIAGAGYQGVFRNPLVDSGMLGSSAGAGLGATIAIVYLGGAGPSAVPVAAFAGSLAWAICATSCGRRGPHREATSSYRAMISWSFTAGSTDQPGRFATTAGVCAPSVGPLSARKMICGLAVTMYSSDSSG